MFRLLGLASGGDSAGVSGAAPPIHDRLAGRAGILQNALRLARIAGQPWRETRRLPALPSPTDPASVWAWSV
jgi:hypothetical protein